MDLEKSFMWTSYKGLVAVHINDIVTSFKYGFADFMSDLEKDKVMKELFIKEPVSILLLPKYQICVSFYNQKE